MIDTIEYTKEMKLAQKQADLITEKMDELGMHVEVDEIHIGPQIISFNCIAAQGVLVRKIPALAPELQYELGSESVSIHAPLPGTKYITIEIANPNRKTVHFKDVINYAKSPLEFPAGISPDGKVHTIDIKQAPHLLIGGQTGGGKSIYLHNIICSLISASTPDDLMLLTVDTKMVELPVYDDIPHLMTRCITNASEAIEYLKALISIMDTRYEAAKYYGAKTLDELNKRIPTKDKLPYILLIVDEVADLIMLSKHEVEECVIRLAQKARACGIHMILATQSPRREVISGLLKCNLPSRIAFATSSELDSRIILGENGAGKLLGQGDCLYSEQGRSPIRLQAPYIGSNEISDIIIYK